MQVWENDCIFGRESVYKEKPVVIWLLTYVDNLILLCNVREALDSFKQDLQKKDACTCKIEIPGIFSTWELTDYEVQRDRSNQIKRCRPEFASDQEHY